MDPSVLGRPPRDRPIATALRSWRVLVGCVTGAAAAVLSVVPATIVGDGQPFVANLPLAPLSVVGLLLGWVAAATAFAIALVALLAAT